MEAAELWKMVQRLGLEHDLFQRALWVALDGKELVVNERDGGLIEYVALDKGRTLVRRSSVKVER